MAEAFLKNAHALRDTFDAELSQATPDTLAALQAKYIGRKGSITKLLKQLQTLPSDDRPGAGQVINKLKVQIQEKIQAFSKQKQSEFFQEGKNLDYSLPGRRIRSGSQHPITIILTELVHIFKQIGFRVVEGPEIETDHLNFTALNIAEDHPARDMHDTFYFDANRLLRTHTSPVQIRVMKEKKPPLRIIAPGKVYRCDSDMTHSPMFHQIEGLCIGQGIHFGHLKAVLADTLKQIFDAGTQLRFRPSFFPFTEPSAEVDISCTASKGVGCRVCSGTGWLEILGAGMVDPVVLEGVGIDPEQFTGYAFGIGIERIAMLKYDVKDIRLFFENHLEFLSQFDRVTGRLHL